MQGSRALFIEFFDSPTPSVVIDQKRPGRNSSLNNNRNECLLSRYYFYGKFHGGKLRYEYIVDALAKEFWISPTTIAEVIDKNFDILCKIKATQPTIQDFKDKWPHLVWTVK